VSAVARTLDVARSHINERRGRTPTPRGPYRKVQDVEFLPSIRAIVDARPAYGYRRVTALLNRERRAKGLPTVNAKRVLRIMQHHGLTLERHTAQRPGRTHDGVVISESAAVALYLTDLFPDAGLGAPVGSSERGTYLTWLTWAAGELEPAMWGRIMGQTETDAFARARYDAAMERLLEALWAGPWLMGERFTAVDVMIGSALGWGRQHLPDNVLFDTYQARLAERPARLRAEARDGEIGALEAA